MSDKHFKCWLTSKVVRRDTGQREKGMYAVQPIAKDEEIWGVFEQVASPLIYAYLSFAELGGESFTHSCDPNAGFRGAATLVAMRPIAPEERITFDYAMCLPFNFGLMPCRCGAINCRKVITGKDWELPALQHRYQGYFLSFVAEKISQAKNWRRLVVAPASYASQLQDGGC